jgi:hypothetical protein
MSWKRLGEWNVKSRFEAIEKGAIHLLSTQTKDSMLSLIHYDKNTNENRRVLLSAE